MEPTFVDGDLLVLRNATPQVGSRVVFREPDSGKVAVKSVAGLPGQRVQFVENDLYLDGKIHRRPIYSATDLVPMLDTAHHLAASSETLSFPFSEAGFLYQGAQWKLEGRGAVFLKKQPLDSYLLRDSFCAGDVFASDLGVEVAYELLAPASELHLFLHKGRSLFTLVLADGGSKLRLLRVDQPDDQTEILLELEVSPPRPQGSAFFTLANRAIIFALDGKPLIDGVPYQLATPPPLSDGPLDLPTFELAGVGGVGPLLIGRLRLGRDISYRSTGTWGGGKAFQLADDEYFLIGDNPSQSRDSRNSGAVSSDRILGTVAYRAWPLGWSEQGWARD